MLRPRSACSHRLPSFVAVPVARRRDSRELFVCHDSQTSDEPYIDDDERPTSLMRARLGKVQTANRFRSLRDQRLQEGRWSPIPTRPFPMGAGSVVRHRPRILPPRVQSRPTSILRHARYAVRSKSGQALQRRGLDLRLGLFCALRTVRLAVPWRRVGGAIACDAYLGCSN